MSIDRRVILLIRVFLVALFGVLVVFQGLSLPGQFAYMAREQPDLAYLRWPLTAASVFWVFCMQVVVVATWALLRRVRDDQIFTPASLIWVDAIVWAVAAAWLVLVAVAGFISLTWDDPGLPMLLLLMTIGVGVIGLLMTVLRALLRQATTLRTEMEAVI